MLSFEKSNPSITLLEKDIKAGKILYILYIKKIVNFYRKLNGFFLLSGTFHCMIKMR